MILDTVRKRDGIAVPFDKARIESAISKAFLAAGMRDISSDVDAVVAHVLGQLEQDKLAGGEYYALPVELIQERVETSLMELRYFEVAKQYIRYRSRHTDSRTQRRDEITRKATEGKLSVRSEDGRTQPFALARLRGSLIRSLSRVSEAAQRAVDLEMITDQVLAGLFDGIESNQISQLIIQAVISFSEIDPAYDEFASFLLRQKQYDLLFGSRVGDEGFVAAYRAQFVGAIREGVKHSVFAPEMAEYDLEAVAANINPDFDAELRYMGLQTLTERYFARVDTRVIESFQGFWMRVAMGLALAEKPEDRLPRTIEFYRVMAELRFTPSTPTLFHAGLSHPQLSSCYLSTVEDDLTHIFKVMGDNAALSKWSGGIGNDWTNIRATGALIKSTQVQSQGVIPFLKIANDVTVAINRSGKRRGAACAYLETWHLDIEDFLDLKRNTGDDRRRTHDMNTANWIPDLFMKRVAERGTWTLFSPNEVPDLHHIYGKEFEKRYLHYEEMALRGEIATFKQVEAIKLWRKMLTRLFETGHPWITFKDPSNVRSPQDHVGVVHNSNLCTEITLNNSADETAVCNLGSINLVRHIHPELAASLPAYKRQALPLEKALDLQLLDATVSTAIRMLDNVIDINYYPTPEASRSNFRHRPIGLGIMGFQDVLYEQRISFTDEAAAKFADTSMERIAYAAISASSDLAVERGAYETFRGSKWDRGIFPLDTLDLLESERGVAIDLDRSSTLDWDALKVKVKKQGLRNSNTMAIAPTATISTIVGCYPCIEPIYKNMYVKSNMSGEFTVVNPYLVNDLKALGLWNRTMVDRLKYADGSVQDIEEIPEDLRRLYLEAFEINPEQLIEVSARRGKWIDQSQSHNVFVRGATGPQLENIYMKAWLKGLKTTYYLRTLAASQIEKSTLDAKTYGFTQNRKGQAVGGSPAPVTAATGSAGADAGANLSPSPVAVATGGVGGPIGGPIGGAANNSGAGSVVGAFAGTAVAPGPRAGAVAAGSPELGTAQSSGAVQPLGSAGQSAAAQSTAGQATANQEPKFDFASFGVLKAATDMTDTAACSVLDPDCEACQ